MEFIVDDETGEYYFLEVNTRLQVRLRLQQRSRVYHKPMRTHGL